MRNDASNYKKITFRIIVTIILVFTFFSFNFNTNDKCFAETSEEVENELSENINGILNDIDSDVLDSFLENDFNLEFFDVSSFKELAVKILDGNYFSEYDGLFDAILSFVKEYLKSILSILVLILCIVLLHEMFNNFCIDKYAELKKSVKIIFSLVVILLVSTIMQDIAGSLSDVINKIFNFTEILFPILLNLILLSGATGTFSVYSSLSVFLLNTGSYIFVYVLMPLSISILILSLLGSVFSNKRFAKTIDIFKSLFKWIVGILFAVFGLFSAVNIITAGVKDGVSVKITKFALKNYIPILGGYISDGFDFVQACSVLVKNAFGLCGVFALFFIVAKPLLLYFVYLISFKILSLFASYVSSEYYSDMFDNVSKCMGYFVGVLIGVFLIMFVFIYLMIFSVSVV